MLPFILDIVFGILLGTRRLPVKRLALLSLAAGVVTSLVFNVFLGVVAGRAGGASSTVFVVAASGVVHGLLVLLCAYLVGRRARRGYRS